MTSQLDPTIAGTASEHGGTVSVRKGLPRSVDVVAAFFGLLLVLPLLIVAALIVTLTSRDGFLFRQERVGRYGKLFVLYKLRTMIASNAGPQVTSGNDKRITRVGKALRQTKLDELPTLWNVFKGDMALVGPRPEVPRYVKLEDPTWQTILSARPGITDPVTLQLRNEEDLIAKIKGDPEEYYLNRLQPLKLKGYLDYLKKRSASSDLRVLGQTIRAVIWPGDSPSIHSRDHSTQLSDQ